MDTLAEVEAWVEGIKQRSAKYGHSVQSIEMGSIKYRELGRPKTIAGIKVRTHPKYNKDGEIAVAMGEFILSCNCGENDCDYCMKRGQYA